MKEIKVKYKTLGLNWTSTAKMPTAQEELTSEQFLLLVQRKTDDVFLSKYLALPLRLVRKLDSYERFVLVSKCEEVLSADFVANRFFVKKRGYVAPSARLNGVTMRHFVFFDTFFFIFATSKKEENLVKFIASLYLKRNESIQAFDFIKRCEKIKKDFSHDEMTAIAINYIAIRKWLARAYPSVFSYAKGEADEGKAAQGPQNGPDWQSVIDSFASDNIINLEKYYDMPCLDIFRILNKRISEYKKQQLKR